MFVQAKPPPAKPPPAKPPAAKPPAAKPPAAVAPAKVPLTTTPSSTRRLGVVVADAPVSLRIAATLSTLPKVFNGATIFQGDEVEIMLEEDKESTAFYYIRDGRKKGFVKAEYVKMRDVPA